MSNERLLAAITAAGLDPDGLADEIGVDTKTIERWISGRTPHRRNRIRLARILNSTPHDLWPDEEPASDSRPEPCAAAAEPVSGDDDLVASYLGSEDPRLPDRRELLAGAQDRIDILGLRLDGLITSTGDVQQFADRADDGCNIRILIAAPDSIYLAVFEAEHNPALSVTDPPALVWEIEQTIGYLQPLLRHPNVEARTHVAAAVNSILRVDDMTLVTLHLHGAGPIDEPIIHLQARQPRGLSARFAKHFDQVWNHAATPLAHDPDRYPDPDQHPDLYHPQRRPSRPKAFGRQAPARPD